MQLTEKKKHATSTPIAAARVHFITVFTSFAEYTKRHITISLITALRQPSHVIGIGYPPDLATFVPSSFLFIFVPDFADSASEGPIFKGLDNLLDEELQFDF